MPVHDWSRVSDGTFHAFLLAWIAEIQKALNRTVLPEGYYARAEQVLGGLGPDILTLQSLPRQSSPGQGGTTVLQPPKAAFNFKLEQASFPRAQRRVVIRHESSGRIVALIEIVSAGNKSSQHALDKFVNKVAAALSQGIHFLIIDLQPPTPRDPNGLHTLIWERIGGEAFTPPPGQPLTLVSYEGGPGGWAHVEPIAVGQPLPDMPLYLEPEYYVQVPLERTYMEAWGRMPAIDHAALRWGWRHGDWAVRRWSSSSSSGEAWPARALRVRA
jgi:hypothetical protein